MERFPGTGTSVNTNFAGARTLFLIIMPGNEHDLDTLYPGTVPRHRNVCEQAFITFCLVPVPGNVPRNCIF